MAIIKGAINMLHFPYICVGNTTVVISACLLMLCISLPQGNLFHTEEQGSVKCNAL